MAADACRYPIIQHRFYMKISKSLSAPFICLLLLGCPAKQSPTKQTPVGLWRAEKGPDTIEFLEDGSVRLTNVVNGPNGVVTLPMGGRTR